jgi:hypothetical protein
MADSPERTGISSLGVLGIFVLVVIVVVALLYLEQDRKGAQDLAAAKARWKAAGFSLTASDYYPKPVPDDQNLAALPVFRLEPDPYEPSKLTTQRLRNATDEDKHGGDLYSSTYGAKHDEQELVVNVSAAYAKEFPGKKAPVSSLAQLEALYPFLADIRAAAPTHPIFRINQDYGSQPPFERPLGPVTAPLKVAKLLSCDAKLALREKDPQVAVDDFQVSFEIARGVGIDPSLVGGLVELGCCAITRGTIDDGLTKHTWNDSQLAAIQDEFKRTDCLALYQFDMRAEPAANSLPMYEWLKHSQSSMALIMGMASGSGAPSSGLGPKLLSLLWANGWWDMNAAQTADLMLNNAQCVDLKARGVDAKRCLALETGVEKTKEHPAPWNILYAVSGGPLTNGLEKFAQGQVQLDEDRIVCGLERFRIAHGAYPARLTDLVPACLDDLPHDIMNGEPYHYRLNPDGTFLLYSVGWNQVDEGGAVATLPYSPKIIDYKQGDWVWPMVKR